VKNRCVHTNSHKTVNAKHYVLKGLYKFRKCKRTNPGCVHEQRAHVTVDSTAVDVLLMTPLLGLQEVA